MNKRLIIKLSVVFIVILICILSVFVYIKNQKKGVDSIFLSELLVYYNGDEYEILLNKNTKETYLRINEDKEICFTYPREGKSRVQTPDFTNINGENTLQGKQMILNYTYNMSFEDSYKYLKLLLDDGYIFKMYAINSEYMECFIEKGNSIKRLIILSDTFMICDLIDNGELPDFLEYFKSFDFNGNVVNKICSYLNKL